MIRRLLRNLLRPSPPRYRTGAHFPAWAPMPPGTEPPPTLLGPPPADVPICPTCGHDIRVPVPAPSDDSWLVMVDPREDPS